ncbi:flagellar hook-length control protein FliK [Rummeliibacillus stabekisii]|uniref:flagellar hook-length control protein FliK n=1 Tax=Rummeliibacillus stabekisii TaxID=241244 RepID=UPI00203DB310|nr:flagellar hook-length control protein FliK [Rummeliibacillus stabekisii]MCM3315817.1 flagellar hook-length control protein FliK [Rummeliibacillus stabekisii]
MNIDRLDLIQPVKVENEGTKPQQQSERNSGFLNELTTATEKTASKTELNVVEIPKEDEEKNTFRVNLQQGLEGLLGASLKLSKTQAQVESNEVKPDDLMPILQTNTLEELGQLLNVKIDEDELTNGPLTLDKILSSLGIQKEEFQKTIKQLTEDDAKVQDIWDLLASLDQNAYSFIQKIVSSINGGKAPELPKAQTSELLKVLKVVALVSQKTDMTVKQEYLTYQAKEILNVIAEKAGQQAEQSKTSKLTLPKLQNTQDMNIKTNLEAAANNQASTVQPLTKEITSNHTISIALPDNKAGQAETFVKEFQSIIERMQISKNMAGTKLLIKLYPENLGSIRVELSQKDGLLTARFLASTAIGKDMLESQIQQLKQGLVNQHIQLDRIDVAQALSEPARNEKGQQQFQQQSFKQQTNDDQQQPEDKEERSSFEDFLMEMEV